MAELAGASHWSVTEAQGSGGVEPARPPIVGRPCKLLLDAWNSPSSMGKGTVLSLNNENIAEIEMREEAAYYVRFTRH